MNPMLQAALGAIIRAGLMALAGYLVRAGIWEQADATIYASAATLALLTIGWSIYQKYVARSTIVVALSTARMTERDAQALAFSAIPTPPVTSPPDVVPTIGVP